MRSFWRLLQAFGVVILFQTAFGAGVALAAQNRSVVNCTDGSPYDYTAAELAACGVPTDPVADITSLPGGGQRYDYEGPDGSVFSEYLPPAGFDPETATNAQLAEYALPPRPSDFDALLIWQQRMQDVHFYQPPGFITGTVPGIPNVMTPPPFSGSFSNLDGGYAGTGAANTFTFVQAGYYEPTIGGSHCTTNTNAEGTWAGIGNTGYWFGQSGTYYTDGGGGHFAFAQVWNPSVVQKYSVAFFTVSPNDYIVADVQWTGSGFSGSIQDGTKNNEIAPWSYSTGGSSGNSGEVFVEQPMGYNLANFQTWTVWGSFYNNGTPFNQAPGIAPHTLNGAGTAKTNGQGSQGNFTVLQTDCN